MRIALLGTRGPGFYGGFETCVAELAPRLAARGHEVTVYARSWSESRHWRHEGVRVVSIPSVRTKNLDTITHSALCAVHAMTANRPDVAAVFGVGNAMFARSLRAARVPTVLNVDGLDRQRAKWGRFARWWLSRSERWAIPAATVLVTDAHSIKKYYSDCYGADSTFIPYGAPDGPVTGTDEITGRGLVPGGYVLYVSRLEPENNAHIALEAYASSGITLPFVVVGGAAYGSNYESSLHELATDGVVFCGFVFGEGYRQLQSHACVYLQCTEVGGTHPALIEAMAYGNAVVALDTREH
ncbi:MAG TPA: glycosyltransferase, partial [Acidimicrobiales bacterium]|nr:glycosyltransferase [Acidimicrobiales bacterium]